MNRMPLASIEILFLSLGGMGIALVVLIRGGDWTIDAAVRLAQRSGLSPALIGATVVAFGTSAPELVTSVRANLGNEPGLALGNVVGSNIANLLLVIGATALLFRLSFQPTGLRTDFLAMLLSSAALLLLLQFGEISRGMGAALFAALLFYMAYRFRRNDRLEDTPEPPLAAQPLWRVLGLLGLGLIALIGGAELLVFSAVQAGKALAVPTEVIGLTVVALGTSVPEIVSSIAAARKRQNELLLGSLLGSNLFNVLSIVGLTALVKPLAVSDSLAGLSAPFMLLVSLAVTAYLLVRRRLTRLDGAVFLLLYLGYTLWQYGTA